ncbi:transcriptional regulator MNL1-like [Ctenocephalides felis]|uniref:transcriptional regulator MNL1-like n=1 Tax=Ctenocephalides felis TaxID=7515 RepID=UPI000E6E1598|nr:transcriptional regulator MNL1-like [Ctenocephalides felis]
MSGPGFFTTSTRSNKTSGRGRGSGRSNDLSRSSELRYICPNDCGRSYLRKETLRRHLRLECGVERKHRCGICDQRFVRRDHVKVHLIHVHGLKAETGLEVHMRYV